MGLYPTLPFQGENPDGMQMLPPSTLLYRELILPPSGVFRFQLLHVAPTQDFSMQAWISVNIDGITITHGTSGRVSLPRVPLRCALYDESLGQPDLVEFSVPATPGQYVLNILNRTNSENIFSYLESGLD